MNRNVHFSTRKWWLSLTSGIVYLILGTWVLTRPESAYLALQGIFIAGFGLVGLMGIYYAVSSRHKLQHWRWSLLSGLIDLTIALILLITPGITAFILPLYVGFVLMFRSLVGIGFSTYLAHFKVRNWGLVLILSALGVFFSLLMIWNPHFAAFTLIIYTALALFTTGFTQIGIAYELRRFERFLRDNPDFLED